MLFAALYLSEGAPVGFIWWALPAIWRAEDIPVQQITALTSLLVLPWALKFLWAPLIDTLRGPQWGFRAWIISAQLAMGLALFPLLFLSFETHRLLFSACLLAHAFFAATQDVAVDALCISTVPAEERGSVNGLMQVGYLAGRAAFGGAALVLVQWLGQPAVIIALVACVWFSMLLVLQIREPAAPFADKKGAVERRRAFFETLRAALQRKSTWLGLTFALIGGAAFEAVGAVAGPLLVDTGLSQAGVGVFFIAFALPGAILGGRIADRFERRRAVGWLLILIAVTVGAIAACLHLPDPLHNACLIALMGVLYLLIGAFTASSYALFMDLTDPKLGATQFSAMMGATNMCEAWSTRTVGILHGRMGYAPAFLIMAALSLIALPIVRRLRTQIEQT